MKKLIFLLLIVAFSSCSLFTKLAAPKYNAISLSLAQSAFTKDSSLFAGFKQGIALNYSGDLYDEIGSILTQKITLDSIRKYSTQILIMDHTWLNQVESSRKDHQRDGRISVNHINVNGALLNQIGRIVVNTETKYK